MREARPAVIGLRVNVYHSGARIIAVDLKQFRIFAICYIICHSSNEKRSPTVKLSQNYSPH